MSDTDDPVPRGPRGRFPRGQSGNPKGRPRKSETASEGSAFDIVVERTLTITRNGQAQEVGVEEALQHRTYQDAIAGNRSARREILKMILKREQALAKRRNAHVAELKPMQVENSPDNANEALRILGIACDDPRDFGPNDTYDRLKMETWAVQAALRRRRGGEALTDKDIDDLRRCSLAPDRIKWPKRGHR